MSEDEEASRLDRDRLDLERFKAELNYRKFIWGSVVAAITIAAIPPLFQFATAGLEYVKSRAKLQADESQFRENYITSFMTTALNQDIELRIRLAEYFSYVSTPEYAAGWKGYLKELTEHRDGSRKEIDELIARLPSANDLERTNINRQIAWKTQEVGYQQLQLPIGNTQPIPLTNVKATPSHSSTSTISWANLKGWVYSQSTGSLSHEGEVITTGYSGLGSDLNNPDAQSHPFTGPIPQGDYTIGAAVADGGHMGPFVLPLTPSAANNMFGRAGFYIHGDSEPATQSASNGSIVLARQWRTMISQSADNNLHVIP
jgi:hypothetical protein